MIDTTPLPIERQPDGGKNGRGCDYQLTCFHCTNWRRCERLGVATMKQTFCNYSPSRFVDIEKAAT